MTTPIHPTVRAVTDRIVERSATSRAAYLRRIRAAADRGPARSRLACANLAHGFAASDEPGKQALRGRTKPNVAIVTSYNDMLSAHQPFETYPRQLKRAVIGGGGIAQVAGGVPAMCDGITQGRDGMQLSLYSRDVIAMSTAIALSHDMFDGALMLGVCDKIVPGLLIGALSFGHLPTIFVPAGPMPSGLPNGEKARVRQLHAEGKVGREDLLAAEAASYHSAGTCTFYGTANSNQLLMEVLGLHLPGSAFVNPGTPLREALTEAAGRRVTELTSLGGDPTPVGEVVDERAVVNACVALLASGGSTNHTMHLVAIARAAGVHLTWQDLSDLSAVVPSLARVYPNGSADINHFHAAGGVAFLVHTLLRAGLVHDDVLTVAGRLELLDEPLLEGDLVRQPGQGVVQGHVLALEGRHRAAVDGQRRHDQQADEPQAVLGDRDDERRHRHDDAVHRPLQRQVVAQRAEQRQALLERDGDPGQRGVDEEEDGAGQQDEHQRGRRVRALEAEVVGERQDAGGRQEAQGVLPDVEGGLPPRQADPAVVEQRADGERGGDQRPVVVQEQGAGEGTGQADGVLRPTTALHAQRTELGGDHERCQQDERAVHRVPVDGDAHRHAVRQEQVPEQGDRQHVGAEAPRGVPEEVDESCGAGRHGQPSLRPKGGTTAITLGATPREWDTSGIGEDTGSALAAGAATAPRTVVTATVARQTDRRWQAGSMGPLQVAGAPAEAGAGHCSHPAGVPAVAAMVTSGDCPATKSG